MVVATVYLKHRTLQTGLTGSIGSDACPVLEDQAMGCKLQSQVPVNGGLNLEGPKVAKFLVG